jgi:phage N-6-adenine-methyltransferase
MTAATRFDNGLRYSDGRDVRHVQLTPPYVLDRVRDAFGGRIGLDPCTEPDNPTDALVFYTEADDGLAQVWPRIPTWCNPPYAKAREPWVERCLQRAALQVPVVLLIPAATDTRIWQRAAEAADAVVLVRGRLKFEAKRLNGRSAAASHPSSLLIYNANPAPLERLGLRL